MRYIGNKEHIIDKINSILSEKGVYGETFFDFFSGTANVAKYYKKLGYKVYSSDILYLSYCLQKAYIDNNRQPKFKDVLAFIKAHTVTDNLLQTPLEVVVGYLNTIEPVEGFVYHHYTPSGTAHLAQPRMYYTDANGKIIDAIRITIEQWNRNGLLTEDEYYILISCLIETVPFYANISGVYAAFNKKWDPRALKKLTLRTIDIVINEHDNIAYSNRDSVSLCSEIDVDILYLDPPYNERQYAPNYHVLETIARYDEPEVKGVTGMREYKHQKSKFCNAKTAVKELDFIAKTATYKHLVLSYNSEGIMAQNQILEVLGKYGLVSVSQFRYVRYKSNNNGLSGSKKHIYEQLYILTRDEN